LGSGKNKNIYFSVFFSNCYLIKLDEIAELILVANNVSKTLPGTLGAHLGRLICGESIWTKNLMQPELFFNVMTGVIFREDFIFN